MLDLITILGPTASGKTTLAVALAAHLDTEIISADSRQIYRSMDIGTGKDLAEYTYEGKQIPYHLIDICPPGYKYNLFEYIRDYHQAYDDIVARGKTPILCGGTGLYIEAVLKGYALPPVPENPELRQSLADKTLPELEAILQSYKTLHNQTDTDTCNGLSGLSKLRVLLPQKPEMLEPHPVENALVVGVNIDRESRRARITQRLHDRLDQGMVAEVQGLLDQGIDPESLIYYGLEYKYITEYLIGRTTYDQMVSLLEIAIHQFAKRQMTWFRGMERRGFSIFWLDAFLPLDEKLARIDEEIARRESTQA